MAKVIWQKAPSLGSCRYLFSYTPGDSRHREVGRAGYICDLYFWGRGGRWGGGSVPFERGMVVSYGIYIVTVALSLTIRPQFAIE